MGEFFEVFEEVCGKSFERFFAAGSLEFEVGLAAVNGDEVLIFANDFCFGGCDFRTGLEKAIKEANVQEADLVLGDADGGEGIDVEGAHFDVLNAAFFDRLDRGFFVVFRWTFWANARVMFGFALEEVFVDAREAFVGFAFRFDGVFESFEVFAEGVVGNV